MAMPGMNTTGTPDAIDSTDYVMTIIRAIRRFPSDRKSEIEKMPMPSEAEAKKMETAFRTGYFQALDDLTAFMQTVSRGI